MVASQHRLGSSEKAIGKVGCFGTLLDRWSYVGPDRGMITRTFLRYDPVSLLGLARERTKFCLCDSLVLDAVGQLLGSRC